MGSEVFLYIDCKGTRLTVRAPSYSAPKADEEVFFQFDRNKLHLFDAETEEVIR